LNVSLPTDDSNGPRIDGTICDLAIIELGESVDGESWREIAREEDNDQLNG
jgi:hypothetical protein